MLLRCGPFSTSCISISNLLRNTNLASSQIFIQFPSSRYSSSDELFCKTLTSHLTWPQYCERCEFVFVGGGWGKAAVGPCHLISSIYKETYTVSWFTASISTTITAITSSNDRTASITPLILIATALQPELLPGGHRAQILSEFLLLNQSISRCPQPPHLFCV